MLPSLKVGSPRMAVSKGKFNCNVIYGPRSPFPSRQRTAPLPLIWNHRRPPICLCICISNLLQPITRRWPPLALIEAFVECNTTEKTIYASAILNCVKVELLVVCNRRVPRRVYLMQVISAPVYTVLVSRGSPTSGQVHHISVADIM